MRTIVFLAATGVLLGAAGAMCLVAYLRSIVFGEGDNFIDYP